MWVFFFGADAQEGADDESSPVSMCVWHVVGLARLLKMAAPGKKLFNSFFFLNKKSFGEFRSIDLYVSLGAQSRGMQNPLLAGRSLSSSGQLRKSEGRKRKKKDVVGRGLYGISFRTDPHAQNNKGIENNLCNNSSSSESKKNRKKKLLKESRKVRSRPFPSSRDTQAKKKKKKKKKNKQRSRKTVGRQIGRVPRERQHTQRRRNNRSRGKLGRILFNWRFIGRGQLDYFSVPPLFLSRCRKKKKKRKDGCEDDDKQRVFLLEATQLKRDGGQLALISFVVVVVPTLAALALSLSRSTRARLPQLARPDINKQTNDEKLCLSFVVLDSNSRG